MLDVTSSIRDAIKHPDRYVLFASRPSSIQRLSPLAKVWFRNAHSDSLNFPDKGKDVTYYFAKDNYRRAQLAFARRCRSEAFIRRHLSHYRLSAARFLAVSRKLGRIKADRSALIKIYQEYQAALLDFGWFFFLPFAVDEYVFPDLSRRLRKILPPARYDSALKIISSPTLVFDYQKYQSALLRARSARDYWDIVARYYWLPEYSHQEPLLTVAAARAERKRLLAAGVGREIRQAARRCARNRHDLELLLRRIGDPKVRSQIRLVNEYINIKTRRMEIFRIFQANSRNFFRQIRRLARKDLPSVRYEDIISLTDEEIIAYLTTGKKFDLRAARRRYNLKYAAFARAGRLDFVYSPALIKQLRAAFQADKESSELRGVIVSTGKVRGRVRVINKKADLLKIRAGDILVANFTTPEYVTAIKTAAAIVTDDGGVTSHAAIIARELSKPCIVGTKNATRLLRDGDKVEVDADRGIVRKL